MLPDSISKASLRPRLSVAQFRRAVKKTEGPVFAVHMMEATQEVLDSHEEHTLPVVQELAEECKDVFENLPLGLPPLHSIGHTIMKTW